LPHAEKKADRYMFTQLLAFIKSRITVVIFAVFLASCSTPPARPAKLISGDYEYIKNYGSWLIKKEMKKNSIQGLSIVLVDDQKIVWAEGFGYADKANGIKVKPDTVFRAGSLSKIFTVTAAMQLVEQGKINLDSGLKEYIPEFSMKAHFADDAPIKIRHLMNHHSGMPTDYYKGMLSSDPKAVSAMPGILKDEYLAFEPDTVFLYSNPGMDMLGLVLERVSGREYTLMMRDMLLEPLGMKNSSFSETAAKSALASKSYRKKDKVNEAPLRDVPAGGLNTSVNDLSRYMKMVFASGAIDGSRILSSDLVEKMLEVTNAGNELDMDLHTGLGWILASTDLKYAGRVAQHDGSTIYQHAQLIILPEAKLGIAVLSNTSTSAETVAKVSTDILMMALETKTGLKPPELKKTDTGNYISQQELDSYAGDYSAMSGLINIAPQKGYLKVRLLNYNFRLVPRQDKKLKLEFKLFGFIPIGLGKIGEYAFYKKKAGSREVLAVTVNNQDFLFAEKYDRKAIPEAWKLRVGRYLISNPGTDQILFDDIRIKEKAGLLVLSYKMPELVTVRLEYILDPLSDTQVQIFGAFRGMGDTIRAIKTDDGSETLMFSGYELKKEK
jgi:CubicO group peptidase (beta-lactamase class C family)